MAEKYVSIVGFKNYFDKRPFAIGTKLLCVKEPDNVFDSEAIKVTFPVLGTVGYIANSILHTALQNYPLAGSRATVSAAKCYMRDADMLHGRRRRCTLTMEQCADRLKNSFYCHRG